jgi:hypothetical protein
VASSLIYSFLRNLQLLRGLWLLLDLLFSRDLVYFFFSPPEPFQEVFCGLGAFEAWTLRLRLTGQCKQSLLGGSCF